MRDINGHSEHGCIRMSSKRFCSVAYVDKTGAIHSKVESIQKTKLGRNFLLKCTVILALLIWYYIKESNGVGPDTFFPAKTIVNLFCGLYILGILFHVRFYIASWHGAEHMVIAAYERTRKTDLNEILKESPVHNYCGTRFFITGIICLGVVLFLWEVFEISFLVSWSASLLVVSGIEYLVGWDKIKVVMWVSYFLQKYILTRQPGIVEIKTAQRAMEGLIAVHEQAEAELFDEEEEEFA